MRARLPKKSPPADEPKPQSASRFRRKRRDGTIPQRKNKPGAGRPQEYFPTQEDRDRVERLAGLLCSFEEIAHVMRISRDTLLRHYRPELDRGPHVGKVGVKQMMMALLRGAPAEYDPQGNLIREEVKPDPAMIRFFARTKLGYVEEYKLRTTQTVEPEAFDWSKLDEKELAAAERIFAKALANAGGGHLPELGGDSQPGAATRH